jgi:hypothetical protein
MPSKPSAASPALPAPAASPESPAAPASRALLLTPWIRTAAVVALGLGMAGAVVRAGSATKFWEKRAEMQRELRAEQQRLGLNGTANQKALYTQFPTPEITLCKAVTIAPGGSSPVNLGGKFAEKTVFLAANDDVTLNGTLGAGKFTGTASAAADAGPGWAPVHAIAPVSGANRSCAAIFVGSVTPFEFKGDNGWTIKLTPQAKAFALSGEDATLPYAVTFFKDGEAKPFKTMAASMTFRQTDNPSRDLFMSLNPSGAAGSPEAELAEIQRKLSQPDAFKTLGLPEISRLSERMGKLMEGQMKDMNSPGYNERLQKEQDEFGCRSIAFSLKTGEITGNVSCGRTVGRSGTVKLTGGVAPAA